MVKLTNGAPGALSHIFGQAQNHRDGAQRLGHATHAGRLLADQAVPFAQILVVLARGHAADTKLGCNITGAAHTFTAVGGQKDLERRPLGLDHALRKAADDLQPLRVDIHQPELGKGKVLSRSRNPLTNSGV